MGYVPPNMPPRVSAQLQELYRAYDHPIDFGQQWIGGHPKNYRPDSPYQRYVYDLYGPAKRDLSGIAGWVLIGDLIAAVVLLVHLLTPVVQGL